MQRGDLSEWQRPRWTVVIEGVLCTRHQVEWPNGSKLWARKRRIPRYHNQWHDLPLKRCVYMATQYTDFALDMVTFHDDGFVDEATEYLDLLNIPYQSIRAWDYEHFCTMLRFTTDIKRVYDSDPDRLQGYGQLGSQVLVGQDF